MTKVQICINVDNDVVEQFKRLYPNKVSAFCNEQMRLKIDMANSNTTEIDILLAKKELQIIAQKATDFVSKRTELQEKIRLAEEKQAKTAEESLRLEKEKIISAKRCAICTQVLEDKKGIVQIKENVIVCKACYDPGNPKLLALLKP